MNRHRSIENNKPLGKRSYMDKHNLCILNTNEDYDIKDSSCVYLKVNKGCTRKSNEKLTRTCLGYINCFWHRASFGCIYLQSQWVQSHGGVIKSTFDNCKEFKSMHMRYCSVLSFCLQCYCFCILFIRIIGGLL